MPRIIVLLIVLSLGVGILTSLKGPSQPNVKIKGQQTTKDLDSLPVLKPLPRKSADYREPAIAARNVVVIDVDSGRILYEKEGYKSVSIASLTKIMTAIIILEENDPSSVVEITKEAALANGSIILLRPGEKITVENLLKGLLIQSGNDAAFALAANNSGSIESFTEKMNQKAKTLGISSAIFKDPAGLDDAGTASARDVAILMAYALNHEKFKEIIKISETTIYSIDGQLSHKLENSNRLVKEEMFFPGIIGGKTGFTPLAGHNMVAAATRDGHTLIAVIINTHSPTKEASAIEARKALDWAFTNHVWATTDLDTD
jgi:D-alanyl-D-alanine carboxypeptidase